MRCVETKAGDRFLFKSSAMIDSFVDLTTASCTSRRRFRRPPIRPLCSSFLLLLTVIQSGCVAASNESECFASATRHAQSANFLISPSNVCVPEGFFLVLRGKNWEGLVRFYDVRDVNLSKLEGCARYEIHMQAAGRAAADDGRLSVSSGAVASLGSVGVHPLVVERGTQTISAGAAKLWYGYPTCLTLTDDLEVAPTPWRTIEEVNLRDKRLRWYRLDPSGTRSLTISLNELQSRFSKVQ